MSKPPPPPTNRLHSATRWPADPEARLSLALTDKEFIKSLWLCGCSLYDTLTEYIVTIAALERERDDARAAAASEEKR
jgi:hypothetical protein